MHTAKKRFGQHFLTDDRVIEHLVKAFGIGPGDHLVEIGPGLGSITDALVEQTGQCSGRLDLIELDRDLVPILRQRYQSATHVAIHEQDALRVDYGALQQGNQPLRVVGNLPYNISTPLIFHLLKHREAIQDMVFMMQEEVVDRIVADSGNRTYGRLSLMVQVACAVEKLFTVPPQAFDPPPKVMSAIVRMQPHQVWQLEDEQLFAQLIEQAFIWRRKMFKHTLKQFVSADQLEDFSDLLSLRPEQISLENFVRLANMVYNRKRSKN